MLPLYESPGELFSRTKDIDELAFKRRLVMLHCGGMPVQARANVPGSEHEPLTAALSFDLCPFSRSN